MKQRVTLLIILFCKLIGCPPPPLFFRYMLYKWILQFLSHVFPDGRGHNRIVFSFVLSSYVFLENNYGKMDSKDLDFLLGSGVSVEYPQFVMTCEDVV